MQFRPIVAAPLLALALAFGAPLLAQTLPPGVKSVGLLEGWRQPDGTHVAAVEIRLAPGWHTYWRAPGEAGIPPEFDWSGSRNLAGVRYEWPTPLVFDTYGMPTIGYEGELVLPVLLRPEDPSAPIDARLELFFGACDDICVPAGAVVGAHLAPGAAPHGKPRIDAALAQRPRGPVEAGITDVSCRIEPSHDGYDLTAALSFASDPDGRLALLEAGDAGLWVGMPESRTDGRRLVARARIERLQPGAWVDRRRLRVTVLGDGRAVDIQGCGAK